MESRVLYPPRAIGMPNSRVRSDHTHRADKATQGCHLKLGSMAYPWPPTIGDYPTPAEGCIQLLISQRCLGVYPGCAPRGNVVGKQRDEQKQQRHTEIRRQLAQGHTPEKERQDAAQPERNQ